MGEDFTLMRYLYGTFYGFIAWLIYGIPASILQKVIEALGGKTVGDIASLLVLLFLPVALIIGFRKGMKAYSQRPDQQRKKNELEHALRQKQSEQERELQQKQLQLEDKKYERIINCPPCEGNGKTYIQTYTGLYQDGSEEYTEYLSTKDSYDKYNNDIIEGRSDIYKNISFKYRECPYCKGSGVAYAWFEKKPASSRVCDMCHGSGKTSAKVKLEIGMGTEQVDCIHCHGTGSIPVRDAELAHIKTISGGADERHTEKSDVGGEIGPYPVRYIRYIVDGNKTFYSTSKPRFS